MAMFEGLIVQWLVDPERLPTRRADRSNTPTRRQPAAGDTSLPPDHGLHFPMTELQPLSLFPSHKGPQP